ncbi:hypothetical protein ACFL3F_05775 [Planctomycetota bacterium]
MTIRTRLLVLLLGTALVPLAIISLSHHIALRWARQRLTTNTRETLDSMAQRTLLQELGGYVEVLVREKQLVQALLQRQAREIEWALAQTSSTHEQPLSETTFGYDPNLQLSMEQYHPCFQDSNDPNVGALQIDYQRQTYAWMPRVENQNNKRLLTALASLTPIYHDLYQKTPDGTLWLMTRFDEGLTTRYPSAQVPPDARPFGQGRASGGTWSSAFPTTQGIFECAARTLIRGLRNRPDDRTGVSFHQRSQRDAHRQHLPGTYHSGNLCIPGST